MAITKINISNQLHNPSNQGVADASQIAYSYKTVGEGDDAYEIIDKNLRLKIEDIESMTSGVSNIDLTKEEINEIKRNIDATAATLNSKVDLTTRKIDNISSIADSLLASLQFQSEVQVVSTDLWREKATKLDGIIYFVYDNTDDVSGYIPVYYNFKSYGLNNGQYVYWAEGRVLKLGNVSVIGGVQYDEILVVENSIPAFENNMYYVNSSALETVDWNEPIMTELYLLDVNASTAENIAIKPTGIYVAFKQQIGR